MKAVLSGERSRALPTWKFATPSSPEETKIETPWAPSFIASVLKVLVIDDESSDSIEPYEIECT